MTFQVSDIFQSPMESLLLANIFNTQENSIHYLEGYAAQEQMPACFAAARTSTVSLFILVPVE